MHVNQHRRQHPKIGCTPAPLSPRSPVPGVTPPRLPPVTGDSNLYRLHPSTLRPPTLHLLDHLPSFSEPISPLPRVTLLRTTPVTGANNQNRLHPSTPRPRPPRPVSRCLARRLSLAAATSIGCTLAPLDPQPCTFRTIYLASLSLYPSCLVSRCFARRLSLAPPTGIGCTPAPPDPDP